MHGIDRTGNFDIPIGSPIVRRDGIANGVIVPNTSFVTPSTGRSGEMIDVVSGQTVCSASASRHDAENPGREASTSGDEAFDAARAAPHAIAAE